MQKWKQRAGTSDRVLSERSYTGREGLCGTVSVTMAVDHAVLAEFQLDAAGAGRGWTSRDES